MGQQTQIFTLSQRVECLALDLTPFRRWQQLLALAITWVQTGIGRRVLAKEPERVERRKEWRVFQTLPAGPVCRDRLK